MDLSPGQRAELLRFRAQLRAQQAHLQTLAANIETALVHEEAIELAVSERIGHPAEDGTRITAADDFRAEEIVRNFWGRFE